MYDVKSTGQTTAAGQYTKNNDSTVKSTQFLRFIAPMTPLPLKTVYLSPFQTQSSTDQCRRETSKHHFRKDDTAEQPENRRVPMEINPRLGSLLFTLLIPTLGLLHVVELIELGCAYRKIHVSNTSQNPQRGTGGGAIQE
jgi:hypothetical protein